MAAAVPPDRPKNPYRQILARRYPEPFVALLLFLLGIWVWDHYFGKPAGYAPGTSELALVRIDRDVRLAEGMAGMPSFARKMLDVPTVKAALDDARHTFGELEKENAFDDGQRVEAVVILLAAQGELNPAKLAAAGVNPIPEPDALARQLASGDGKWWQAKLYRVLAAGNGDCPGLAKYDAASRHLVWQALVARGAVWMLVLVGLPFLPGAIRVGFRPAPAPSRYSGAWKPTLGLVVFLMAVLGWIGFSMALEFLAAPGLPSWLSILLDAASRLLPVLIVAAALFRRGRHVFRSFGLDRGIPWKLVLGGFALMLAINRIVAMSVGCMETPDPAGGLSLDDSGGWGLAYAVSSACLFAPFTEEILYRGLLFRSLANGRGALVAAAISTGFFALLHFYNASGLVNVAAFGLVTAAVFSSSRSLAGAIALHMIYNASIKFPEWLVYHSPLR